MKFNLEHDPANRTFSLPYAALQMAELSEKIKLSYHVDTGCVLVMSAAPTTAEMLKTVQALTEINTELLTRLAKASVQERGTPDDRCEGCRWEEPCFNGKLLFCALAEAGIDPEGDDLHHEVRDGAVILQPQTETKSHELMKGLDEDFRAMLESVGVSLSGLFLLLKKELDAHE